MNILDISIILFVIMETTNICILYFWPDSKYGNGVAVFDNWEDSKEDENMHLFARYMACWVAGAKLIFLVLLLVILFIGDDTLKVYSVGVMVLSIGSYFWKLHPIIKKLDANGKITPKGYSKALGYMITGFMLMFSAALIIYLVF